MSTFRRVLNHPVTLKGLYYTWLAFPYPIRKPLTALVLMWILLLKKLTRVDHQNSPTPMSNLGDLSFWGVPEVDSEAYSLEVIGELARPLRLSLEDLTRMESVERPVRMDCVGGFRNNSAMKGVSLSMLLQSAEPSSEANAVVFHCADGYSTAHLVSDLLESDAFLAYEINGQRLPKFGYPLRLVAPETYGYKWAKWVVRVELVRGFPKGYWEERGLPHRGRVGEVW